VYECLEEVLVRTKDQQENKIKTSIKPVIERKLPERECKTKQVSYSNILKTNQ